MRMGNESRLKVGWGRGKWVTREKAVTEERRWGAPRVWSVGREDGAGPGHHLGAREREYLTPEEAVQGCFQFGSGLYILRTGGLTRNPVMSGVT